MSTIKFEDFESTGAGSVPTGFVATNWTVSTSNPASGSTKCMVSSAFAVNTVYWNTLDGNSGNVKLKCGFRFDAFGLTTNNSLVRLVARATVAPSAANWGVSTNHYMGGLHLGNNDSPKGLVLYKHVSGTETQLGSAVNPTGGDAFVTAAYYTVILKCDGTTISLQCQRQSDSFWLTSAAAWQSGEATAISVTDSAISAQGYSGVMSYMGGANGGPIRIDAPGFLLETATDVALTANVASLSALATTSATIAGTAAVGGTNPKSYQLQRGTDGSTFGTNVGSPQSLSDSTAPSAQASTGLTDGLAYAFRWQVTDSAGTPAVVNSNTIWAVPHAAGTSFYVASGGSDTNVGSSGSPWQTFTKANRYGESSILAGDSLLLNGGDTFTGSLRMTAAPATSAARFTVGKYGSGVPTISCSNSYGVWLDGCTYSTVQDLTITGSGVTSGGVTTSTEPGIKATLTGAADLNGIMIARNTISGTYSGINLVVNTSNANSIVRPEILGNVIHDVANAAIGIWQLPAGAAHTLRCTSPQVQGNTVYNVYGDAALLSQSGAGLVIGNCSGGLFFGNLVHHTGAASYSSAVGGPTGILAYECNGTVFSSNEIYNSFAPEGVDGQGLDLDGGCVGCVVERNYIHDCDGPAFMVLKISGYTQNNNNVIRWNVCQNNGRRSAHASGGNAATFIILNGDTNTVVHNNTSYDAKATGTEDKSIGDTSSSGAIFRDNIFTVSGSGATFGSVKNGSLLQGNCYDAIGGASFSLTYNSVAKTSLSSLQGVAETVGGVAVGTTTAPGYTSAGGGSAYAVGTIRYNLSAYDASAGATLGLDMLTVFSTDPGQNDFHGNPVRTANGYPVGAVAAPFPVTGGGSGALLIGPSALVTPGVAA